MDKGRYISGRELVEQNIFTYFELYNSVKNGEIVAWAADGRQVIKHPTPSFPIKLYVGDKDYDYCMQLAMRYLYLHHGMRENIERISKFYFGKGLEDKNHFEKIVKTSAFYSKFNEQELELLDSDLYYCFPFDDDIIYELFDNINDYKEEFLSFLYLLNDLEKLCNSSPLIIDNSAVLDEIPTSPDMPSLPTEVADNGKNFGNAQEDALNTRRRNNYLKVILALADPNSNISLTEYGAQTAIVNTVKAMDMNISTSTVGDIIKEAIALQNEKQT